MFNIFLINAAQLTHLPPSILKRGFGSICVIHKLNVWPVFAGLRRNGNIIIRCIFNHSIENIPQLYSPALVRTLWGTLCAALTSKCIPYMHIAAMTESPMIPPINPEFRIARGRVKTPIPILPFKMCMIVSKFLSSKKSHYCAPIHEHDCHT